MKLTILKHVPFEGPGMILDWAEANKHDIEIYNAYLGELPNSEKVDLLVIMGGPMSANDTLDWLVKEKEYIKKAIEAESLVFGICLGAQLIAKVLGANVYRNSVKEIGWHPITCADNFLNPDLTVLHWHGETFDLPNDSELLASSIACKNQAFAYKDTVLGLQFHLEMNKENIKEIIQNCEEELVGGEFIQSKEQILSRLDLVESSRMELYDLLDGFEMRLANGIIG